METYNLAVVLRRRENDAGFVMVKQARPPEFGDKEYDSLLDSDLWDLPSARLDLLLEGGEGRTAAGVEGLASAPEKVDFGKFDLDSAISRVLEQVGLGAADVAGWRYLKFVEEAKFGPGFVHTVYFTARLVNEDTRFSGLCKWMSVDDCLGWLLNARPGNDRVGPLVSVGLINDSIQLSRKVDTTLNYQEYPPGVILVPMTSRTGKPFSTTNLVIFAPENISTESGNDRFAARGDALIVDPGCLLYMHDKLSKIVGALPRNLVVFLTHHHPDHVDGLSVIQKVNPNAILVAHENTMKRVCKDDWSLGYTSVSGGEHICIGGQSLQMLYAPYFVTTFDINVFHALCTVQKGHTDGHMGLLHEATHSLIVGDHCVGQGSAILDVTSGGNMTDYFRTTYKFIELSPQVLIPMHGRVNLWPKNMLCGYLKNRRSRELSVLEAIENGAQTLLDIVAHVYSDVDRSIWVYASSNVRLHVDHLAEQNKLPAEFSMQKFQKSCGIPFLSRWLLVYVSGILLPRHRKPWLPKLVIGGAMVCIAVLYSTQNKRDSE